MIRQPNHQQGVALIIALVITTIAVSLASLAMYRQQLQIRLSGNILSLEQAYEYAVGMEDWSKKILEQDYNDNPNVDSLQEDWATLLPPIPIPGGSLTGQLFDLQGRINLNALALDYKPKKTTAVRGTSAGGGKQVYKTDDLIYNRIVTLIQKIDTEQTLGPPQNFTDTIQDWIDKDDEEKEGGAESNYYQSLEKPYMTANALITNPSEVLLLKGMTKELYGKLLPFISTSPSKTINVNTAPKEVLEAVGFDTNAVNSIIKLRDEAPFESMTDFWDSTEVKDLFDPKTELGKRKKDYSITLGNTTNYFLLKGQVNINNTRIFINSILERKKGKVRVIMRDYGNPF
ncbi:MAG TPA: general secretion pathway protein GspK [Leucothrix mucor]|nr:general secretion pathway protein GspK [Leucothrix mucor]